MSVSGGAEEEEEEFLFGGVDRRVPHPVPRNGGRRDRPVGLVIGTLYGHRRSHVRFAFQTDATASRPAVLVELATPTCALVREMASGLARIALEREPLAAGKPARELAEEPVWKAYVNGKNCGFAVRRECQESDWKLMRAVQPVSMGAGVIPAGASEQDVMYMRARFERVVGSKDSEAFYMLNSTPTAAMEDQSSSFTSSESNRDPVYQTAT